MSASVALAECGLVVKERGSSEIARGQASLAADAALRGEFGAAQVTGTAFCDRLRTLSDRAYGPGIESCRALQEFLTRALGVSATADMRALCGEFKGQPVTPTSDTSRSR